MEYNNTNISILAGIFLLAGIIAWLVIPMIQADTTIFLQNGDGNTPIACNGNTGLVLAQNLTDLCDVTIISPNTNQIIQYNGSQWINVDQVTFTNETTVCSGQAGDYNLIISSSGGNCDLKNLLAGQSISLSDNGTHITITGTTPCVDVGPGHSLCGSGTLGIINIRSLLDGDGISIQTFTDHLLINNTSPESTICTNQGIGIQIFKDGNCNFRTLKGSPDISIVQGTNDITIDYNGTLASESTQCINVGTGTLIIKNSTSGNCYVKTLKAGTGLSIVNGTNDITYANTAQESTVCTNDGHGTGIVCNGGNVHVKGIASGTGITITQNGTDIIVTSNAINESTVCSGQTGNYNIVASSSGGNCTFKNLVAGTGESLSSNSTHITITNISPESTIGTNLGSGAQVFKNMTATTLYFRTLLNGTGISVTSQANTLTFTNLYSCTSAGGTTLIKTSTTGLSCDLKGLTAGVGLTLTSNTNDNNYKTNFANGTGVTITGSTTQTFTNTGVISNSCTAPISCSGTNPSAISYADNPYWQMLCTNAGTGASLSCSAFAAKEYLYVQILFVSGSGGTALAPAVQFNSDTGTTYAWRNSANGAADTTSVSTNQCSSRGGGTVASNGGGIITLSIENISAVRKIIQGLEDGGIDASSATAPSKNEFACKWDNTASQITTITLMKISGTNNYATGTQLTVWGHD